MQNYKNRFSVSCYTTAHTEDSAYFFGGYGGQSRRVARYYNDDWTEKGTMIHGNLNRVIYFGLIIILGRYGHGAITLGSETMHIGGTFSGNEDNHEGMTEVWVLPAGSKSPIKPELPNNYSGYKIGLFLVPFDYCS